MDFASQQATQWYVKLLPRATQKALKYLADCKWLKKSAWYLAGGTALALQVGHRQSVDLDFFTLDVEFNGSSLIKHFSSDIWHTDVLKEATIYGKLYDAKISFIAYPFFKPKERYRWYFNVPVLDSRDIAVMKVIAVSQRGKKRDFVDLYWYCHNRERLIDVFHRLPDQYSSVSHNYHHIIKSISYFADAEGDPMPKLFFKASWSEIKKFFQMEARNLAIELLGLK